MDLLQNSDWQTHAWENSTNLSVIYFFQGLGELLYKEEKMVKSDRKDLFHLSHTEIQEIRDLPLARPSPSCVTWANHRTSLSLQVLI